MRRFYAGRRRKDRLKLEDVRIFDLKISSEDFM